VGEGPGVRAGLPQEDSQTFDPYYKWLGIPPNKQPPNHYTLLGIGLFESDAVVIQTAAEQRTIHLRSFHLGPRAALSQRLLNEVSSAKACVLDPPKKAAYDATLREQLASDAGRAAKGAGSESPAADGLDPALAFLEQLNEPGATPAARRRSASRGMGRILPRWLAIAGAAGAAVVLLTIIVIVRNRQGEELARVAAPTGSQISVEPGGNVTVTLPDASP